MVSLTSMAPDIVATILDDALPNHILLLDLAARAIDHSEQHHAHTSVVRVLADFGGVHGVGLKRYAVVRFDRADLPEDGFDVRQLCPDESQKISIPGWAMWKVEPQVKQQGTLEQKLIRMPRDADPVQKSLNRITCDDQVEILLGLAGAVEQTGTY